MSQPVRRKKTKVASMHTIKEVESRFAAGAESVTLQKEQRNAIMEICRGYFATDTQLSKTEREIERIKALWWACKIVSSQMRACSCSASQHKISDWEIQLRLATEVDWHDLRGRGVARH